MHGAAHIINRHTPRMRSIQYAVALKIQINALEYWIIRFRG